jgi:hypothetical protein
VGDVFCVVSVFSMEPSGFWTTVVSFDLTAPLLVVVEVCDFEIVRSHPIAARHAVNAAATIRFLRYFMATQLRSRAGTDPWGVTVD